MTTQTGSTVEPMEFDGTDLAALASEHAVVLVDFYADWCGPCQMMEPAIETVAENTDATVVKVDVDSYQALAGEYGVQGVPTLVLFADGEPVERLVGLQDAETLAQKIAEHTA